MSCKRLDIVIFGASGFTGKRTIPQLSKLIKSENLSLTWGIAGRSEEKLKEALREMEGKAGEDYSNVPILCADFNDVESLEKITSECKIIVNAIGPYRFSGERVVQACIKTGTHHVDVSGELQYMESMQLKYHRAAMDKGVYLISACGLESVPVDLGAVFLQKNFDGTLNSIETYLHFTMEGGPISDTLINYTSFESGTYLYIHHEELKEIRSKLYPTPLPRFEPRLEHKGLFFWNSLLNKWCTFFPGPDRSVCSRTQRYLYETQKRRPVQMQNYLCCDNFLQVIALGIAAVVFMFMCLFDFTKDLLLKHPKFFTFGMVGREGPSDERQEKTKFDLVLVGEGWNEKLLEVTDKFTTPPDKTLIAKVSGKNPGYGSTCVMFALAAIMVLTEGDKMPNSGGCYTPGAAFENTSMVEKLNKYGVKFELNPKL